MTVTVGVLALQGGVVEHLALLAQAAQRLAATFDFIQVRSKEQLARCDALIIPGGESTTMAIVAARLGLLEPLRQFVKVDARPVWGTCAGLVMLASSASATKQGGQDLIGGLDVHVLRNRFGRQIDSFVADLDLPFLAVQAEGPEAAAAAVPFRGVFIRAPVVVRVLSSSPPPPPPSLGSSSSVPPLKPIAESALKKEQVQVLGVYQRPGSGDAGGDESARKEGGDIVAVRQGNVFATSFHPELTDDVRIHVWWLRRVLEATGHEKEVPQ